MSVVDTRGFLLRRTCVGGSTHATFLLRTDDGDEMPQRMFAHCPATGCNTRKPFMVSVFQGEPSMRDENGLPFDPRRAHFWPTTAMRKPMERRGIWCAEHGPMRVYELKATFNPDRKCDGRCTHAKRPQCDCSCNGANHGSEV